MSYTNFLVSRSNSSSGLDAAIPCCRGEKKETHESHVKMENDQNWSLSWPVSFIFMTFRGKGLFICSNSHLFLNQCTDVDMCPHLAGLISRTLCRPRPGLVILHPSLGQLNLVNSPSGSGAAPLVPHLRVHLLSLMWRVPALRICLRLGRGARHVLARRGRGVRLFCLSPGLRVGDGLCRLDLDAEPGPGGSRGRGVRGRDGLRVGLRVGGGVVVLLVGGGVLRWLVLTGVRGHRVVLALGMRGVAHGWPTLRRGLALVCRFVMIPWEVFVVRHIVVQLRGNRKFTKLRTDRQMFKSTLFIM